MVVPAFIPAKVWWTICEAKKQIVFAMWVIILYKIIHVLFEALQQYKIYILYIGTSTRARIRIYSSININW